MSFDPKQLYSILLSTLSTIQEFPDRIKDPARARVIGVGPINRFYRSLFFYCLFLLFFSFFFFIDSSKSVPRVEDWKVGEYLRRLRYSAQGYCIRGLIPPVSRCSLEPTVADFCLQKESISRDTLNWRYEFLRIRVVRFVKLFAFPFRPAFPVAGAGKNTAPISGATKSPGEPLSWQLCLF